MSCLQVLGGAGPAIAAVPLTVVWAGTSALSLLNNIRTRQVGPLGAVQRVGFVLFTGVGQIISAFSRMGAATMTYLPPTAQATSQTAACSPEQYSGPPMHQMPSEAPLRNSVLECLQELLARCWTLCR